MPGLDKLAQQLANLWRGLAVAQRIAFLSVILLTVGAVSLLVQISQQQDFATLYSDLAPKDSARIVDELSSQNVPYRLTHAGTAIQVPLDRVYDLRLEMAAEGLPASGPVGFEIFDEGGGLAMTPLQQRVRYRRALEGELGRTISRLAPVNWARVHINIPARGVLARRRQKPTASIVISLVAGGSLEKSQGQGIAQLVAGAVEGLEPSSVSILNSRGRLLVRTSGGSGDLLAAEAVEVRQTLEQELAQRAQTLLDAALGTGGSVVTVAATIDTRRVDETQNRVDPDQSAVISEQRVEETRTEAVAGVGGVPGTPSNVPGGPGQAGQGQSTSTVNRETINFDVTRSTTHTVIPIGAIQRLSVAVLVDGTYVTPEGADEAEYTPRTDDELRTLTEIVKRAVGFDETRGDVIEVQNLPFRSPLEDLPEIQDPLWERPELLALAAKVARGVAVLGGFLLLTLLVIRPTLRLLATPSSVAVGGAAAAGAPSGGGTPLQIHENAELAIPISKDQAKVVAEAMKQWLRE